MKRVESAFEHVLFTSRWLMAPVYFGLVLAMAFESVFKLAAMLALGLFVWFGLRGVPAFASPPVVTPVASTAMGSKSARSTPSAPRT